MPYVSMTPSGLNNSPETTGTLNSNALNNISSAELAAFLTAEKQQPLT